MWLIRRVTAVSRWSLCVMSGFEWFSLYTTHFAVEALFLAQVLFGMQSSFLRDRKD